MADVKDDLSAIISGIGRMLPYALPAAMGAMIGGPAGGVAGAAMGMGSQYNPQAIGEALRLRHDDAARALALARMQQAGDFERARLQQGTQGLNIREQETQGLNANRAAIFGLRKQSAADANAYRQANLGLANTRVQLDALGAQLKSKAFDQKNQELQLRKDALQKQIDASTAMAKNREQSLRASLRKTADAEGKAYGDSRSFLAKVSPTGPSGVTLQKKYADLRYANLLKEYGLSPESGDGKSPSDKLKAAGKGTGIGNAPVPGAIRGNYKGKRGWMDPKTHTFYPDA